MAFFLISAQPMLIWHELKFINIAYAVDPPVTPGSLRSSILILQSPQKIFLHRSIATVLQSASRVSGWAIRGASIAAASIFAGYDVLNAYNRINDALKGVNATPCLTGQRVINVTDASLHEDEKLVMAPEKFGVAQEKVIQGTKDLVLNFGIEKPKIIQENQGNKKIILMYAKNLPSSYQWFPQNYRSGDIKVGGAGHRGLSYTEVELVRYEIYIAWTNREAFQNKGIDIPEIFQNDPLFMISASTSDKDKSVTLGQVFTQEILNAGIPLEFEAMVSSVWQPTRYIINPGGQILPFGDACNWDNINDKTRQDQTLEIAGPALGLTYTPENGAQEQDSQFTPQLTVNPVVEQGTGIAELTWTEPKTPPDGTPNYLIKRVRINQNNGLPDPQGGTYMIVPDGDIIQPKNKNFETSARVIMVRNIPNDDQNWKQRYGIFIKAEYKSDNNSQIDRSNVQEIIFRNKVDSTTGQIKTEAEKGAKLEAPTPTEESGGSVGTTTGSNSTGDDDILGCGCTLKNFEEAGFIMKYVWLVICNMLCMFVRAGVQLGILPFRWLFNEFVID